MIKKTVKYIDLNGEEQSEEFYFNLNKVEAVQITANAGGDIQAYARYLAESKDLPRMIQFIQDMILGAVGIKDPEGRRFIKSPEIRDDFENSIAYAELFEELLSDPVACKAFGEGLVQTPSKAAAASPQAPQLKAVADPEPMLTPQQQLEKLIKENPSLISGAISSSKQ